MTPGEEENGGYYNYNPDFIEQKNEGVEWITDFSRYNLDEDQENPVIEATLIKKLKHIRIGKNQILVMFEVWQFIETDSEIYDYSGYLIVDDDGHPHDDGVIR